MKMSKQYESRRGNGLGWCGVLVAALLAIGVSIAYAADPTNGQRIYNQQCADCHGADGKGSMPGVPNFTLGQTLLQSDSTLANIISTGKNVMPGFEGILTQQQIYDVISYIRTLH